MQKQEKIVVKQKKYPQISKSKQTKEKPAKNIFCFIDVKLLILAKKSLESLPENDQYDITYEVDYARKISQALPLMSKIRIQQIEYVVSEITFKKLMVQLTRQVQFKQIVIVILKEILKGVLCYHDIIIDQLFDMLSFLVQMEGLTLNSTQVTKQSETKNLKKCLLTRSIYQLIKSIIKWYSCSKAGLPIATKYRELLQIIEK